VDRPFPAYTGDEPYVFVSYSHDDAQAVYPELARLCEQGFNIWYDEGITPGLSWREELATAIDNCALFLMLVTPRSVNSPNCQKELNFAESHDRPILAVHLEETNLPLGLELVLGDRQAILRYQHSASAFQDKLSHSLASHAKPRKQETDRTPVRVRRGKPMILAVVGLILVISGYVLVQMQATVEPLTAVAEEQSAPDEPINVDPKRETSIMVLPFDDLSPADENSYFAAGMYEDVVHRISGIPGLAVIARNTAMKFAGTTKSARDIGNELAITHLLTGSVRRAGDQVRINVQLIGTDSDRQVWSKTYDRQLTDIFAIQSDVATQIAKAMEVSINVTTGKRLAATPTENLAAYELYIEGRELERLGTTAGIAEATTLYRRATQMAPEFAEAHAHLAISLAKTPGDWDREGALRAAELGISLNAAISEVQFAMATFLRRDGRFQESFEYFERALELNPNDSTIRMAYGSAYAAIFDIVSAQKQWEKSLYLDPLSADTIRQIGHVLEGAEVQKALQGLEHNYGRATGYFERAVTLEPNNLSLLTELMWHLSRVGQQFDSLQVALRIHREYPNSYFALHHIATTFINNGQGEAASRWINRVTSNLVDPRNALSAQLLRREGNSADAWALTRTWVEAHPNSRRAKIEYAFTLATVAREFAGEEKEGESIRLVKQARQLLDDFIKNEAGDYVLADRWIMSLGLILADSLGDREGVQALAELVIKQYESQPFRRTGISLHVALAYALLGERDTAIEKIQELDRLGIAFYGQYVLANWFEENHLNNIDLSDDVAYQTAVQRMGQRNDELTARLMAELPELYSDTESVGHN
jgi:TolB-like protein